MAAKWLMQSWEELFAALEQATTEDRIKEVCEAEIDAWRARPGMKKESSLRVPMTDTRNEIMKRLQGEQQAVALKYMSFSEEWYRANNAPSQEKRDENLSHQQLLKDPDAIVAKAVEMLQSPRWQDVAVGLAALTGRRLAEVLQVGTFEKKTAYSVMFGGQLKRREAELLAYEIPTLCAANLVLDAVVKLRTLLDVQDMDTRAMTQKYSPLAQDAANRHFADLVPGREGEDKTDSLYSHLFRSVYARIAVFFYCPPTVADIHFMAEIQGHKDRIKGKDDDFQRSYASNAHYFDYKIADRDGNIDGRQGIKLGMPGVELLEVYKPKSRKVKTMAKTAIAEKVAGKNHPVTVDEQTYNRVQALRVRLNQTKYSETLTYLLDAMEERESKATHSPISPENLAPAETAAAIKEAMAISGQDFQAFLVDALSKEAKFRLSLSKRHADKDFSKLTTTQLTNTKHPEATKERIRRAIIAIAKHNDQAQPMERWFINASAVHKLVGGRFSIINEYFAEHQSDIDRENDEHELTAAYNRKPIGIESVIKVPETVDEPLKLYEHAE